MAKVNVKLGGVMSGPGGVFQAGDVVQMERSQAKRLQQLGQGQITGEKATVRPREMRRSMADDPGEGPAQVPPYPQPEDARRGLIGRLAGKRPAPSGAKPRPKL